MGRVERWRPTDVSSAVSAIFTRIDEIEYVENVRK